MPSSQFQLRLTVSLNSSLVIWSKCTPRAVEKGRERAFLSFTNELKKLTNYFKKVSKKEEEGRLHELKVLNIVLVHLNYV